MENIPTSKTRLYIGLGVLLVLAIIAYRSWLSNSPLAVNLSRGLASDTLALTLVPSTTSVAPNGTATVDVMLNTGSSMVTAVDLSLAVSGQASITSIVPGDFLPQVLTPAVSSSTTARIIVGSGTTGKQGVGKIATLTLKAGVSGSLMVSVTSATQVAVVGSDTNALSALPASVTVNIVSPSTSPTTGNVSLVLVPSPTTATINGSVSVDVILNTGSSAITAVDLMLILSGPATVQSLTQGTFLPDLLSAATTTSLTGRIVVGSGTTAKQGSGKIATLVIKATAAGTVTVGVADTTQGTASGVAGNVITSFPAPATITVTATPTPTPSSTATPFVSLSASPNALRLGLLVPNTIKTAVLTWSSVALSSLTIDQEIGAVSASGTRSLSPTTTTTYTISGTALNGLQKSASATVNVSRVDDITVPIGTVNILDYNFLVSEYGKTGNLASDLDGSGRVDIFDYNIFVTNYAAQASNQLVP